MRKLPQRFTKLGLFPFVLAGGLIALLLVGVLYLSPQFDFFKLAKKVHGFYGTPMLTVGPALQQQITSGESHLYRIALDYGQYLRVLVEPSGLDAHAILYGPGNKTATEFDCQQNRLTPISVIAADKGTYRLEIRSSKKDSAAGHYTVRIDELRGQKPEDYYRITAERAFAEGERLCALGDAESQRKAINEYERASQAWRDINGEAEEAEALKRLGELYFPLGDVRSALKYYEQALHLYRKLNNRQGEGETLNSIVSVYLSRGENEKAREYCDQALKIGRAINNRRIEALALNNIGEVYTWSGNLQKALEYYKQALPIWRSIEDRRGLAQTFTYFGYTYSDFGESQAAFDYLKQAFSLWKTLNDYRGQALTLTAIGRLYTRLGESQKALDSFNQAMPITKMIDDRIEQARILNGQGFVYEGLGEKQNALECYDQALTLFHSANYLNGEATTLHEIGRAYYSMGENQKALNHFQQSLLISRSISDMRLTSHVLRGIGMAYGSDGKKAKALKYYFQALPLQQAGKDRRGEAATLNLIGRIYHDWRQRQKALSYFRRALLLSQAAGDRLRESLTLYNIALAERDRGHLKQAFGHIEAALQIVESLRTKVASRDLRTSYFASIQQYYELDIDMLMRRRERAPSDNFAAAALEASERARARSLLELLSEARADIRLDGDPALIEQARGLQRQINALAERKTKLLSANAAQDEINTIVKEIGALTAERAQVEAQIKIKSPRYAALTQPQPSSLKEIQQLLDDDTLLLEYALGGERSYLWAVTRTGLKSYELPSRAEIEKVARPVYDLLASSQPDSVQPEKQREAEYWRQASALSRMLLKPVADQLGNKRLLIVADGVLQYIPFAALPIPERERGEDKGTREIRNPQFAIRNPQLVPLIVEHEIVNLPSASTLAVLRRETAGRRPAPKAVAALADPVFETDDMRVLAATGKGKGAPDKQAPGQLAANLPPSARVRGMKRDGGFGRLPATLNEARAIEEFTSESERMIAKGFDASRATATDPALSRYRIIHFATHGILDRDNPELSAIVLSLVDRQGRPQDGYLRLHDIYNLNLPAELVVLSACDTGLGKEFKGEGLIGLTRGFMYAGAARVMASLWKVEDEPTAKLMRHFYRHMLKEGLPPAAALRQAQIALWHDAEWRAPYFWAAFVIQGEWR